MRTKSVKSDQDSCYIPWNDSKTKSHPSDWFSSWILPDIFVLLFRLVILVMAGYELSRFCGAAFPHDAKEILLVQDDLALRFFPLFQLISLTGVYFFLSAMVLAKLVYGQEGFKTWIEQRDSSLVFHWMWESWNPTVDQSMAASLTLPAMHFIYIKLTNHKVMVPHYSLVYALPILVSLDYILSSRTVFQYRALFDMIVLFVVEFFGLIFTVEWMKRYTGGSLRLGYWGTARPLLLVLAIYGSFAAVGLATAINIILLKKRLLKK